VNPWPDDARLWRAVDTFRVLALAYAALVFALGSTAHVRPSVGWAVLGVMAAWTALMVGITRRAPSGPPLGLLGADLAVACAAVLATLAVDDRARIASGAATLPALWAAAPVLAWAVARGRRGGLAAAVCVAAADLVEVRRLSASTWDAIVVLLLVGVLVGYAVELLRAGRADMARAVALEAASRERERLAADIHDSVLQVLAYVRRRGRELGGEAAVIADLAGEQEVRLRSLVAAAPALPHAGEAGDEDLTAALAALAAPDVVVTGPGQPVLLPAAAVHAIRGAVGAALDNVRRHAGERATAWVLLEDEPERVTVTVRDDGVGMAPGRLEEAARQGRLGVQASVRGRLADVGGSVAVHSAPGQGTEVELVLPKASSAPPKGSSAQSKASSPQPKASSSLQQEGTR
jgi:signal transduction histidine kinase